jgi:hypothetical protein
VVSVGGCESRPIVSHFLTSLHRNMHSIQFEKQEQWWDIKTWQRKSPPNPNPLNETNLA